MRSLRLFVSASVGGGPVVAQTVASGYEVGTWQGFPEAAVTHTFDDNTSNQLPVAAPLGFLAPPITAVFLLGLGSKRITPSGAFYGMLIGFILEMIKLTLQTLVQSGAMAPDGVLGAIGAFNGHYFSGVLFVISVALMVGISAVTKAHDEASIQGLTFGSFTPEQKAENRASWGTPDLVGTVVVLDLVVYLYFSFWI